MGGRNHWFYFFCLSPPPGFDVVFLFRRKNSAQRRLSARRSGYDHVLLLGHLVPLLFESGHRPRLLKRGGKVTSIALRSGIAFRDVTKMLAPGTNLRKFGQLFGLQQEKAHFPFSLLSSVEVLRSVRRLPPHGDPAWNSELTSGSRLTPREVEDAHALFRKAECRNLGDYLASYLWLDVEILYRATQEWRKTLAELTGLDFVQEKKFTISSLSHTAGLKTWEKHLRMGSFAVNNSQHYRLLRNGMRG